MDYFLLYWHKIKRYIKQEHTKHTVCGLPYHTCEGVET